MLLTKEYKAEHTLGTRFNKPVDIPYDEPVTEKISVESNDL